MKNASAALSSSQETFVRDIKATATSLLEDSVRFKAEWDVAGPAVPGIPPFEAAARLAKFKAAFEVNVYSNTLRTSACSFFMQKTEYNRFPCCFSL